MELKYQVIKTENQYFHYCNLLERLIGSDSDNNYDEIELLELLIDNYDKNKFDKNLDPIELIKEIMLTNSLKSKDMAEITSLSKGTISKILNYKKGISKQTIQKLSEHFKISQELLNKPYKLKVSNAPVK